MPTQTSKPAKPNRERTMNKHPNTVCKGYGWSFEQDADAALNKISALEKKGFKIPKTEQVGTKVKVSFYTPACKDCEREKERILGRLRRR